MLDLVNGVAGKQRRCAGRGAALGQGQVVLPFGAVDLQFVDARLRVAAGFVNGHAHKPGLLGREIEGFGRPRSLDQDLGQMLLKFIGHQSRLGVLGPRLRKARGKDQTQTGEPTRASFHLDFS